jgi:cyclopropane fatty-acyl-phospholipid synthase-like methyltransferase
MSCKICEGPTDVVGEKVGRLAGRPFVLLRCRTCRFAFVENPWLEYEKIYDAAYYEGRGADPLVDYYFELAEPRQTVRTYEWAGIVDIVGRLTKLDAGTRWLDFGCGNGGLVRHARQAVGCEAVGFEQGGIVPAARAKGIPILEPAELAAREGSFDVVTAIEVLEHVADPLATLRQIRKLLRPGGVFFYTTGNAAPQRDRLLAWPYFIPEIHISLYEPSSMEEALRRTGFEPRREGHLRGWDEIIAFKILKNLRVRRRRGVLGLVPWRLLAPVVDRRYALSDFPVATAV